MPDPHETLSVFAEISVALAGFSGIAIAFGRPAAGALSQLESRRLFNLFTFSGFVLIISLIGISLFHIDSVNENLLWRGGSSVLVILGTPWLIRDWKKINRLSPEERVHVPNNVIYPFTAMAVIVISLQVANAIKLGAAWPFFLALVLLVAFTFQQFILLVWTRLRGA
jgi:hypothetical protein